MPSLLDHQTSQTATGLRIRDVRKSFILIDAEHNPVTSMAAKGEAPISSLIEWQLRRVPTSSSVAGIMDGAAVLDADLQNFEDRKTMLQGRTMKIREAIGIGDIAETNVQQYAMDGASLFAEATKFALQQLRSRMETVTVGTQDSVAQSGTVASSPVPFVSRGLSHWKGKAASGDLPITDSWARTPAASIFTTALNTDTETVITEANVRAVLRSIFTVTKKRSRNLMLFCTLAFQEQFNNFLTTGAVSSTTAPLRRFSGDASTSNITLDVQTYTGPGGNVTLIPHLSLPAKVFGLLLDMDYVKLRMARNARFVPLTEDGSGPRGFADAIFAVADENPTTGGKFIQAT
jgi:hypothetical protein